MKVLSRLFRRLFLEGLGKLHKAGKLRFFGNLVKMKRLPAAEFIRRVLIHVLPSGFHRIRHAGFLTNGIRRDRIAQIRQLLSAGPEPDQTPDEETSAECGDPHVQQPCLKCGGAMVIVEAILRGQTPKSRAPPWEDAAC